jgi:hypothetical protein
MITQYPWTSINDIKFNNSELLNSITMNIHFKKLYDNIYYLNNSINIAVASTTLTGMTTLASSAEIIVGTANNKAVTTSAFNLVVDSINQTSNYITTSCVYLTDTIKILHGEFIPNAGLSTPYVQKISYGNNKFNNALLNFSLYTSANTSTFAGTGNFNRLCYRYLNNNDTTDANILSSIQLSDGFSNPLSCAYIVYYNRNNILTKICWDAIGI